MKSNTALKDDYTVEGWTIHGNESISFVDDNYRGPVKVVTPKHNVVAILPDLEEALRVAEHAITPLGGHGSVYLLPAKGETPTDFTYVDWVMYA